MEWEDVSEAARQTMKELGFFSPTVRVELREVKGYGQWGDDEPGKVYLSAADLRSMAVHMVEVADWLDKRAASEQEMK